MRSPHGSYEKAGAGPPAPARIASGYSAGAGRAPAGAACAALAIGLIGFLALDGWARADCRELLRFGDFASAEGDVTDPELAALEARLRAGQGTIEEAACVQQIGLPF